MEATEIGKALGGQWKIPGVQVLNPVASHYENVSASIQIITSR